MQMQVFCVILEMIEKKFVDIFLKINFCLFFYHQKKVTVWNKGEPNNYHQGEQCVEIIANTGQQISSLDHIGKLNDIPCNKPTLGVICQIEGIEDLFDLYSEMNDDFYR